jgi:hypothetical protein
MREPEIMNAPIYGSFEAFRVNGRVREKRGMVEAAGVEPASEIAVSRENPCSVQFRMFSLQALRTDKMRRKLVR